MKSPIIFLLIGLLPFILPKKIHFISKNAEGSCATFSCVANATMCAVSEISEVDQSIKVTLSDICGEHEYCDIGGKPYEEIYKGEEIAGICAPIEIGLDSRYPGEECTQDDQCIKTDNNLSTCLEGKCTGIAKDAKCESTAECLIGYYCDKDTKRCAEQKSEYDICKSTFECANNLLCYKGICSNVIYSRPIGEKIEDIEEGVSANVFCEYGMTADNNVCAGFGFDTPEFNKQKIVECNRGDKCFYNYYPLNLGSFDLDCQCGYNENGKGYCPIPISVKNEAWKKLFIIKKYEIDNECHSLSRFNCYKENYDVHNLLTFANMELYEGSVYENAVECAPKVFEGYDALFDYTQ